MSVHYKFKSSLEFDTVTFDGLHISVIDLKKAIMQQKKIGKSADFDLQITNAQTKEVYDDDEALIPKNTSVIVARVPVPNSGKKIWERGEIQLPPQDIDQGNHIRFDKLAKTADLANAVASEEEKIKAMMTQSSQEYDVSKYVKSRSMTGPLPANYTCYRCGKPGHWIKNCPTNNLEIKRSTGIPRSFMVPVDGPEHKGALLTSTGDFAVPLIDHQAYKEVKKEKPPFLKEPEPLPNPEPTIPADLLCMLCKDLLQDAVLIPCCGNSFCDECIRTHLLESENQQCPECHQTDVSPDTMIPNRFLRNGVMKFKKETGYTTVKAFNQPLNAIQTSAASLDFASSTSVSTVATSSALSTTSVSVTVSGAVASVVTTSTVASTAITDATKTPVVTASSLPESIATIVSTIETTNIVSTISPSTTMSSVACSTAVSSITESSHLLVPTPIDISVSSPVIVITAASASNSTTAIHSPYSTPSRSPSSVCNTGSTIGTVDTVSSLPVATPPSSPQDGVKENVIQNDKAEEIGKQSVCHEIVPKAEDFNSTEEIVENHNTESATLDIELDDNQPGTPLADEPPVDLEAGIPLESKLPVDALQSNIGSPYEAAIPVDSHNDSSLSPTRDSISGNSIATITTRGPAYMLSGFGFGRTQQNSRQYSQRSNASHESSYGSTRTSRSSRSGYGTPPRERYRQGRRSEHSSYKSSFGGYGSQSSSHHMSRNYQSGTAGVATSLSSHGSQSRYGTQVQSHRVNIPPGYITQSIQRPHPPLSGLPPNYPVQPPPAKHFERGEETGRGILPLPHRVTNDAPYKRKLNSSPLEMHGQVSIPSQPPPPGVAPVLLSTPQTHGGLYPYQHDDYYHESRRMKDRSTVGDPLDDFARQLIEYSREQQRRPSSRHCSRSRSSSGSHSYNSLKSSGWSHSGSHSGSHSSSRSRSRSFSSRSRSPSYRRSRTRSRSRSFSRSSHSRSKSISRSRSRSRGRNSTPRKRSNSKSNSPKNFTRYVPRSPYHQKKDYSATFFNPSYHPSYSSAMPHPTLTLDHFSDRNRYYREQYRPYDDYHNVYNSPRYEQHDQRYDPKYIQEYQRFDNAPQRRSRTREIEKYERGRSRDVSHRRESVSKSVSEKSRETDIKDGSEVHSKSKKKEDKVKHKKHHHKKEGKKEVKQEEHKKKEQTDILEKTDTTVSQNKKASEVAESSKKNILHGDSKDKKHKHKKRKENDETRKKKKSRELARAVGDANEKCVKSKKKKAKKEIGKIKVDKQEVQDNVPDEKPAEDSPHADTSEVAEQSPNAAETVLATDDVGIERNTENVNNPSHSLEGPANDANTSCISNDERPAEEGENQNFPKEVLGEDIEIKKDFEELEQPLAVEAEDEVDDSLNPEMTDDGEKVDSDEGVVHSDDANVPEISFELPEISKWEREELEEGEDGSSNSDSGNLQETKASLPSDIIQRAEKAILQKPLKDAIIGPPTSRDKHRSLDKKISEKPLRSGDGNRDSVVVVVNVKEKETKSKEQGIEKDLSSKEKTEEDSLEITISAEKNKRSVQTKSKTVKRDKSVDSSQSKKLKLDRSKFSDQLKSESLVNYTDSGDNVTTEKLYSSDSCKEFNSKSESVSRKKENIIITKKEKERKCNIETGAEKPRSEDGSKRTHRSSRRSPSNKTKPNSSHSPYQKHEIIGDYNEIKILSKLEPYEHDIDKREKERSKKHRTEGRIKRRELGHAIKEEKSLVHSREHYRETEQQNVTKHLVKRKLERSRSRSYDSDKSSRKGHKSRSQIKSEDRKRSKGRSSTHHSSAERKQLSQEIEPFGSRTDSSQMNFENRTLKESFLVTRSRKESTQDEANFEPNYDETSDSDNISDVEDGKRQSKHHSERRSKKFDPVETVPNIGESEFENMRIQEGLLRAECSNERTLKRRDRSNSTVSSSGSSQTGSVSLSSGTEKNSRKRLRSNSSESDVKHRHHKSKHKKHKKHRHKHKRKKSHKYKQR